MEPDKKGNGALLGAIIIIVLLLIGGFYVWQSNEEANMDSNVVVPRDQEELDALEEDLNSASVDIEANVIESVE